jgi:hypothetical protein
MSNLRKKSVYMTIVYGAAALRFAAKQPDCGRA